MTLLTESERAELATTLAGWNLDGETITKRFEFSGFLDSIAFVTRVAVLAEIADHHPDIVFVDIMMPRLDGYQTCALIKHNRMFKETPVIMLSSKDSIFDKARGRIVGSEQYLTKPFSKDDLLGAIKDYVRK